MMLLRQYRRLPRLVFLGLLLAVQLRAALPPDAQAAFDRGVTAARLPDYPLALRHFEEARKLAPDAPEIYYNLGLAESKIPGRELRAVAWFGAYLAAQPQAANATPIRAQIETLLVRHQSDAARLLRFAEESVDKVTGSGHAQMLYEIADAWAEYGDLTATQRTVAKLFPTDKDIRFNVEGRPSPMAEVRERVLSLKDSALNSLAKAQSKAGEFKAAHATASSIASAHKRSGTLGWIATFEYKQGDALAAKRTLAEAVKIAAKVRDPELISFTEDRNEALSSLAYLYAQVGDLAGAGKTIGMIRRDTTRVGTWIWIANDQFKRGDRPAAMASLAELQKLLANARLSEAERKEQNKYVSDLRAEMEKPLQPKDGSRPIDWLTRLEAEHQDYTQPCPLHADYILDLTAFLQALPAGDGERSAMAVAKAATHHVSAHNTLVEMLGNLPKI